MILKLEDQVCSIESATRLKELGVKQESLFYWHTWVPNEFSGNMDRAIRYGYPTIWNELERKSIYSSYTVAELGELLPSHIFYKGNDYQINTWSGHDSGKRFFSISYKHFGNIFKNINNPIVFSRTTEAEARAQMLCYLISNSLLEGK